MSGFDPTFTGAGTGHRGGSVPDPGATPDPALFLRQDATFARPVALQAVPQNPQSAGTSQRACNIAGYLSQEIIRTSLERAIQDYASGKTTIEYGIGIIALIPGAGEVVDLAIGALYLLYNAYGGGTQADYQAAIVDDALWSKLTCAIYGAIEADGAVTAGNFAAMLAAVAAVTYAHADVISTVTDYLTSLGYNGIAAVQQVGALAVYDCSACGSGISTGPTGAVAAHGTLGLTDGAHDLAGVTKITVGGMTVGGTPDAATLTAVVGTATGDTPYWDGTTHAWVILPIS